MRVPTRAAEMAAAAHVALVAAFACTASGQSREPSLRALRVGGQLHTLAFERLGPSSHGVRLSANFREGPPAVTTVSADELFDGIATSDGGLLVTGRSGAGGRLFLLHVRGDQLVVSEEVGVTSPMRRLAVGGDSLFALAVDGDLWHAPLRALAPRLPATTDWRGVASDTQLNLRVAVDPRLRVEADGELRMFGDGPESFWTSVRRSGTGWSIERGARRAQTADGYVEIGKPFAIGRTVRIRTDSAGPVVLVADGGASLPLGSVTSAQSGQWVELPAPVGMQCGVKYRAQTALGRASVWMSPYRLIGDKVERGGFGLTADLATSPACCTIDNPVFFFAVEVVTNASATARTCQTIALVQRLSGGNQAGPTTLTRNGRLLLRPDRAIVLEQVVAADAVRFDAAAPVLHHTQGNGHIGERVYVQLIVREVLGAGWAMTSIAGIDVLPPETNATPGAAAVERAARSVWRDHEVADREGLVAELLATLSH